MNKIIKISMLLLLIIFSINLVSAEGNFTDLNNVINGNSSALNVILQDDYKYDSSEDDNNSALGIVINKNNFILDGANHIIDGSEDARIFWIQADNVTIKNVNLINGKTKDVGPQRNGGAIYSTGKNLTIIGVNFENNFARLNGGAIYTADSLTIYDSTFIANNAINSGGAIYSASGVSIYNSTLTNNTASVYGGGIYLDQNDIYVYNSNFMNNKVTADSGGAIRANNGSAFINSSNFIGNSAEVFDGGAISTRYNIDVYNSNFINNVAKRNGGAIRSNYANVTVSDSNFINNIGSNGGAINSVNYLTVINSNFVNNTGTMNGGALQSSKSVISNSSFYNNTARQSGGAVMVPDGLDVYNSIFINNNAVNGDGGAIRGYENVNITSSLFKDNTQRNVSSAIYTNGGVMNYNAFLDKSQITNEGKSLNLNFNFWGTQKTSEILNSIIGNNTTLKNHYEVKIINISSIAYMGSDYEFKYAIQLNNTDINNISLLANFNITLNINNQFLDVINGKFNKTLILEIAESKYNITALSNNNILAYLEINATTGIIGEDLVKHFQNGSQYHVTVLDGQGNPLPNYTVTFNINGKIYNRTSDKNGTATLSINLAPDNYIITATGPNGEKISNNIIVLPTLIGEDLVKHYLNESQYHVTVLDSQGNIKANANVSFNINGKFYTRTTNSDGVATLNINLNPGEYIITVIGQDNLMISNKITVLPTLIGKDLNKTFAQKSDFEVEVLNNIGLPFAKQNISININGVFYTKMSDINGIAKLNINLNPGSYIATATWNGYSTSNIIIVK